LAKVEGRSVKYVRSRADANADHESVTHRFPREGFALETIAGKIWSGWADWTAIEGQLHQPLVALLNFAVNHPEPFFQVAFSRFCKLKIAELSKFSMYSENSALISIELMAASRHPVS
jgi:hypothetical protein